MNENMFVSPIDALVAGFRYDELFAPGRPEKIVMAALKWSTTIPGISTLTKPFYEGVNALWGKGPDESLVQLARVVIEELRFRDKRFEDFERDIKRFELFIAEARGSLLFRQAIGATQRTADQTRIKRIGRILLNGALQWPRTDEEQELAQQHLAEFTRVAEILTDTDVLVLRAIYDAQSSLILRYKEIFGNDPARAAASEADWIQAVSMIWKDTQFLIDGQPLSFFNVHSALIRLEAQGLIGRTTSQTVPAQITATPYGLLELGAVFVEYAVLRVQDHPKPD